MPACPLPSCPHVRMSICPSPPCHLLLPTPTSVLYSIRMTTHQTLNHPRLTGSAQQPLRHRRGASLGSQNARLPILKFAPESDSFLTSAKICLAFSLVLDITLETNPLLRHNTTPPLSAISRQKTSFGAKNATFGNTTYVKWSTIAPPCPSCSPAHLPVCPPPMLQSTHSPYGGLFDQPIT